MAEKPEIDGRKAWIACRLKIDPARLKFVSEDRRKGVINYEHPAYKDISLYKTHLNYTQGSGLCIIACAGPGTPEFFEFLKGYSRIGKRPGIFHPILRMNYDEGVEARTRTVWPEKSVINDNDDEHRDPREPSTPPTYRTVTRT
jgi:hypothetical protein